MESKTLKKGKLLRIEFERHDDVVKDIRITGDFFVYPENALEEMEELIKGQHVNNIQKELETYMSENQVKLIGFEVKDVLDILRS